MDFGEQKVSGVLVEVADAALGRTFVGSTNDNIADNVILTTVGNTEDNAGDNIVHSVD